MRIKILKRWLYVTHKWISLILAFPFLLLSISGLIIAFRPELKTLDVKRPVPLENVLQELHQAREGWSFPRVNFTRDYFIIYGRKNDVLKLLTVERNFGIIIHEELADRNFFFNAQTLHESLFLHDVGRMIVGYSGIGLVIVIVTGFGFWLKFNFLNQIKRLFINGSLRKFKDLHLIIGTIVFVPLIFAAITGFLIHYNSFFYDDEIEKSFESFQNCTFDHHIQFLRNVDLGSNGIIKFCTSERPYFTLVNETGIKKLSLNNETISEVSKADWTQSEYLRALEFNRLHSGVFLAMLSGPYNFLIGAGLIILNLTGIYIWWKKIKPWRLLGS